MRKYFSLILLTLLVLVLTGGWKIVQVRERDALQSRLDRSSKQLAASLELFFAAHMDGIQSLGTELGKLDLTEANFRQHSSEYQQHNPGLLALNWVNRNGVIEWVEPEEPNREAQGFDLTQHPFASEALAQARESAFATATRPIELLQGGWGIASYTRLQANGKTVGYLNPVFRVPDVVRECLAEFDDPDLRYVLRHGDDLLGVLGPSADDSIEMPIANSIVRVIGRELTLSVIATPISNASSATLLDELLLFVGIIMAGLLAFQVHVAQTKRAEAELNAAQYNSIFEHAPDAIVTLDGKSGKFTSGNQRAAQLFNLQRSEIPGVSPSDFDAIEHPAGTSAAKSFAQHLEDAKVEGSSVFEWVLAARDSKHCLTEVHLVRMPRTDKEEFRISLVDITERRELEIMLRRKCGDEARGQLARVVAHDFNNLLSAILNSAEILQRDAGRSPESDQWLEVIINTCMRARELTHQLRYSDQASVLDPTSVDLNLAIGSFFPILERLVGDGIDVQLRLHTTRSVFVDNTQIELAILNLVVNARDAMPGGGTITIATRDLNSSGVELIVSDEGEGISEEVLEHIFEPYFTTKGSESGTGVGLSAVQKTILEANGTITVDSVLGKGTTFCVDFPAHSPSEQVACEC